MFINRWIVAGQAYRCRYVCTACGQRNVERGRFLRRDRLMPSDMAPSWQEEVELSGELAQNRALRRFYRLRANVNDRQWYAGLRVPGRCRHCGRMQCWSPALRHGLTGVAALLCLAAHGALRGWPATADQWLVLAGFSATAALAAEALMLCFAMLCTRRQQESCRPWVMLPKK